MANWLELRRGLPGMNGPFLLENRGAYSVFDQTRLPPRMVIVVGDGEKRHFLEEASNTPIGSGKRD
jgi:hypothetical protein